MPVSVYLERVASATFDHNVHDAFVSFAHDMLEDPRAKTLFLRMAERSAIEARFSPLHLKDESAPDEIRAYDFYRHEAFPSTAERMVLYRRFAPQLLKRTLNALALTAEERRRVRHVIVTSCTGMFAPGLDFEAADYLGLDSSVERTSIGFMGCYAAINALKQARHIVRSEPDDAVLVINLELCTLHMQQTQDLGEVLSFLVFGDGCTASLISGQRRGIEMTGFRALRLENTADLITWNVGDQGFDMVLSGQVPLAVSKALERHRNDLVTTPPPTLWAVHPGGRSVLDAVQDALRLPEGALDASREILRRYGNMSSATVMFVLQRIMATAKADALGCAMSFGPGLTAETMTFRTVGA